MSYRIPVVDNAAVEVSVIRQGTAVQIEIRLPDPITADAVAERIVEQVLAKRLDIDFTGFVIGSACIFP